MPTITGTYEYMPPLGTILPLGTHQLAVIFRPDDPRYKCVSMVNTVNVVAAAPAGLTCATAVTLTEDVLAEGYLFSNATPPTGETYTNGKWYKFTADSNATYKFTICNLSNYVSGGPVVPDSIIRGRFYQSCGGTEVEPTDCATCDSDIYIDHCVCCELAMTTSQTRYLWIGGPLNQHHSVLVQQDECDIEDCEDGPGPDECGLTCDDGCDLPLDSLQTDETEAAEDCEGNAANGKWYSFTAPEAGNYKITVCATGSVDLIVTPYAPDGSDCCAHPYSDTPDCALGLPDVDVPADECVCVWTAGMAAGQVLNLWIECVQVGVEFTIIAEEGVCPACIVPTVETLCCNLVPETLYATVSVTSTLLCPCFTSFPGTITLTYQGLVGGFHEWQSTGVSIGCGTFTIRLWCDTTIPGDEIWQMRTTIGAFGITHAADSETCDPFILEFPESGYTDPPTNCPGELRYTVVVTD